MAEDDDVTSNRVVREMESRIRNSTAGSRRDRYLWEARPKPMARHARRSDNAKTSW